MQCENCGMCWGSFVDFWQYTLPNGDELNYCSEKCYDEGVKDDK